METDEAHSVDPRPAAELPRLGGRPKLSLCMIVRDASRTLRPCLEGIRPWVDEMVVVDTGSTDDTAAVAAELGATVRHALWPDSFAAARNMSLDAAAGEWVFWMDADDTIDAANGAKLRALADGDHPPATLGYVVQVRCPAGDAPGPYATDTVVDHVKLLRNHPAVRFTGRIHEQVLPAIRRLGGEVGWTDVQVVHSGSDPSPAARAAKYDRDLRLLELELADEPDGTFALFNVGMTLLAMGRPADAVPALCRSLQAAEPGDSHLRKAYATLAQSYADLGRPATAYRACLQGLGAVGGDDPELLFRKGSLEQALGRPADAERSLRALLARPPARFFASVDHGIYGVKLWHNLAVACEQQGKHDGAADAWRHVLGHDGSNRLAWDGLLHALTAAGDAAALSRVADGAFDPEPGQVVRLSARARADALAGHVDRATELLEAAYADRGSADLLRELCETAFRHARWATAERALTELTRVHPDDAAAHHNLAAVHLNRSDYAAAVDHARRSLGLRPNWPATQRVCDEAERGVRQAGGTPARQLVEGAV